MPAQLGLALAPDERITPDKRARGRRALRVIEGGAYQLPLFGRRRIPKTRGDCSWARDSAGYPCCPYLSCRHHLWNDSPERVDAFAALLEAPPAEWPQTCSLDVADAVDGALAGSRLVGVGQILKRRDRVENGTLRLGDVGRHLGCSGERARQLEASGMQAVGMSAEVHDALGDEQVDWYGEGERDTPRRARLIRARRFGLNLDD